MSDKVCVCGEVVDVPVAVHGGKLVLFNNMQQAIPGKDVQNCYICLVYTITAFLTALPDGRLQQQYPIPEALLRELSVL